MASSFSLLMIGIVVSAPLAVAPPAAPPALPLVAAPPPLVAAPPPAFDVGAWATEMDLGPENTGGVRIRRTVYLITFARVLLQTVLGNPGLKDPSTLAPGTILNCVKNAIDYPALGPGGGRPANRNESPIRKIVVFREAHQDGSFHFHVGVLLSVALGFVTAKRALLTRHGLVSHWSSSHSEWWSVVRYGYMPNLPKKTWGHPRTRIGKRTSTHGRLGFFLANTS